MDREKARIIREKSAVWNVGGAAQRGDARAQPLHGRGDRAAEELRPIVFGLAESTITPLMEEVNAKYPGLKAFSLPSMGEGGTRRHIELGVRGAPGEVEPAMEHLRRGVAGLGGTMEKPARAEIPNR